MKTNYIIASLGLFCSLTAFAFGALFAGDRPVQAETQDVVGSATLIVTTNEDELNMDGDCALREALQAANTDSPVDACTAGQGDDTIELPPAVYTLTIAGAGEDNNLSGDLDIRGNLLLHGHSVTDTILTGGAGDRVLHILAGANVEVQQLTIQRGAAPDGAVDKPAEDGGGILNTGNLMLRNVAVIANRAGNGCPMTIDMSCDPLVDREGRHGGGIANFANLTVEASTIADNRAGNGGGSARSDQLRGREAGNGGGIWSSGSLTVTNSTISGNAAGDSGTGFCAPPGGSGGGIFAAGAFKLDNATISANAPGYPGGDGSDCPQPPTRGVGGGITAIGVSRGRLKNTIIAGNDVNDCTASMVSMGYNLIENPLDCSLTGDATTNILNQSAQLAPLGDYGGATWTHALFDSSPAIDGGSCTDTNFSPVTRDQRGEPRPQINNCDIGAYEAPSVSPFYHQYMPIVTSAESGQIVLWNKLGGDEEIMHSEIGPNGTLVGSAYDYEPAQFDNGYVRKGIGANYLQFPAELFDTLRRHGTIELWINPKVDRPLPYEYGTFGLLGNPYGWAWGVPQCSNVALVWGDGETGLGIYGTVHFSSANVASTPYEPEQFVATPFQPFHVALVWDIAGIDATADTVRVYRDGEVIGATSDAWDPDGPDRCNLILGFGPDYGGYDKFISDNLIVWNYAKTDFDDRFEEMPFHR